MMTLLSFLTLGLVSNVHAYNMTYDCRIEMRRNDNVFLGKIERRLDLSELQELTLKKWTVRFGSSWHHQYGHVMDVVLSDQDNFAYHSFRVPKGTPFITFYRGLYSKSGHSKDQIWLDCIKL